MSDPGKLTIRGAQAAQPWTIPYSKGVDAASKDLVPHILASHAVLHAAKSVGKLAAVFEALDHKPFSLSSTQVDDVVAMSADLMTIALRFANLYDFDLARALVDRVQEKNGVDLIITANETRTR